MNKAQMQAFNNRHIRTTAAQAHLTISEIADMLALPRARVRKIETNALLKLQKRLQLLKVKSTNILEN
jgi:DNA-directed RNA polymerase sigma subunit (sigma70/sigma32)